MHPLYSWRSRTSNSSNAIFQPRPLWCWYVWNKIRKFPYNKKSHLQRFPYLLSRKSPTARNITMRHNNSNTLHLATCSIFNAGRNHREEQVNRTPFPLRGAFFFFLFFLFFFSLSFLQNTSVSVFAHRSTGRRHLRRLRLTVNLPIS